MNDLEQLFLRIRKNADDLDAWKALLELVDGPEKKNDCQKQIDRILAKKQDPVICPQCGAGMNIYFAEPLHDKRAKCAYCGAEIDIPDSYSRTEKQVNRYAKLLPETEFTVYERRVDGGNQSASITSDEIEKLIEEKGLAGARKELEARGIKGVKIHQVAGGGEASSEIHKLIEEQGPDSLKSKDIIFIGSKQLNRTIITLQFLIAGVFIIFMFFGFFSQFILPILNLFYRLPK
jgi:nucleotide-binding universal stress UspA family protein